MNMPKSLLSIVVGFISVVSTAGIAAPTEIACNIYYYHHGGEPRAGVKGPGKTERLDVNTLSFEVTDGTHTFTVFLGNTKTDAVRMSVRNTKTGKELAGFHANVDWDMVPQLWVGIPEKKIAGDVVNRVALDCTKH